MKQIKYAISSPGATIYSLGCFPYILLRYGFEKAKGKTPLPGSIEKHFNHILLWMGSSVLNEKLVGAHLFDAVELHLTDPRMFYNPLEWKINEKMIKRVKGPIASFHAHVESNPLLKKYEFNLSENCRKTEKAIKSQIKTAYEILYNYPKLVQAENPVFVFHPGVARDEDDREKALSRTRENIEYIASVNNQLYEEYGRDRKLIPTIENSARDKLSLCQTIDEWKRTVEGLEDEIKLTLDYGHIETVKGERDKLLKQLKEGKIGENIVSLHLHYSPEVDNEMQHAHAALTKIPENKMEGFENDLRQIVSSTGIRKQGYITLEVVSKDPFDYVPSLKPLLKYFSLANRLLKSTGMFDWSLYRGTSEDQLASLKIAREMIEG